MADITTLDDVIIQGEGKWFKFTYYDDEGNVIVMPDTGYTFFLATSKGGTPVFTATTFDVAERANGIVRANVPASATQGLAPGTYYAQMEAVITTDTDVDRKIVKFKVEEDL